jgi:predicted alpha/beta-hydrolase family hydrolase
MPAAPRAVAPRGRRRVAIPVDFHVNCRTGTGDVPVSARVYPAGHAPLAWLVLAPGAGAGHDHPFMVAFGNGLAARGLQVVTFNFPYIERGRRVPDTTPVLEECWQSVLRDVRERAGSHARLFAGGKSMGGRIASQVAAGDPDNLGLRGLVFLGYPLHPPGRPQQERTAHWPAIHVPAFFAQGERDPFATPEELRASLPRLGGKATTLIVEGGDHSFKVPRKSGRTQEQVYADVQDGIVAWIQG